MRIGFIHVSKFCFPIFSLNCLRASSHISSIVPHRLTSDFLKENYCSYEQRYPQLWIIQKPAWLQLFIGIYNALNDKGPSEKRWQIFLLCVRPQRANSRLMMLERSESSYKNCRSASHNPFHSPFQGKLFFKIFSHRLSILDTLTCRCYLNRTNDNYKIKATF